MTECDLIQMFQKATAVGYRPEDSACKIYFFPLASALLTDEEYDAFVVNDSKVARGKGDLLIRQLALRIGEVMKQAFAQRLEAAYLSVIVYGLDGMPDFCVDGSYCPGQELSLKIDTFRSFPFPDPAMVKASLEAYRRGDSVTTEEYLRQLRSRKRQTAQA